MIGPLWGDFVQSKLNVTVSVQVPLVTRLRPTAAELVRIGLAELPTPLAYRLVAEDHAPLSQQLLHVAVAHGAAEVAPDRGRNDRGRETMPLIARDTCHALSLAHPTLHETAQLL